MFNAYDSAVNSTLTFQDALAERQENVLNAYTYGYQEKRSQLVNTDFGAVLEESSRNTDLVPPAFMKGEKLTKISIDTNFPSVFFVVKDGDKEYLTRLGDFKYTRKQKLKDTYIGQPFEERSYLTTKDGYAVMGYPIGKGPVKQESRYKDPFNEVDHPRLGESPIKTDKKTIGENIPYEFGPQVPIDLTRGKNGLILDKYRDLEVSSKGIISGYKDGIWVPLYKISLASVPNPEELSKIGNTAYRTENEKSGLRTKPPSDVTIRPESIEKSNVNTKLSSYEYKKMKLNLTTAISLQKANNQILQQYQSILQ